jgi:hypothetical protein
MTIKPEHLINSYDKAIPPALQAAGTDIYAQAFIQQTFFGASIMDFSVSLGLNSSSSTLSLRLVVDDLNYGTSIRKNYLRDAVTEGYHSWNRNAFPTKLLDNVAFGGYPNYGVRPIGGLPDGNTAPVSLDVRTATGDIFFAPEAGSPVFFRYYMPDNLNERCVKKGTEGSKRVFNPNTHGACQVSQQNATAKTTKLTINNSSPANEPDCQTAGGIWTGSECHRNLTKTECESPSSGSAGFWVANSTSAVDECTSAFEFNGIFKKYEKTIGSGGEVYNVEIVDPRVLLENTTVILKDIANRTAPADAWMVPDSERTLENGWIGQRNILNVFGYYESVNMGNSNTNDAGMVWWDPEELTAPDGKSLLTAYLGESGWGILGALDIMLFNHDWHTDTTISSVMDGSGHNNDGIVSDYVLNGEPFGGPLYYGWDGRDNTDPAPLGKRYAKDLPINRATSNPRETINVNRYKVDLTDLQKLSEVFNPGECRDPNGNIIPDVLVWLNNPPDPAAKAFRDDEMNCQLSGGTWRYNGTLPRDYRINADKISLLSLIEQVCSAAGADFFVSLERPNRAILKEENYAGVIKVTPIFRSRSLVTPVQQGIQKKIDEKNWLSVGIDLALDKKEPTGPFTRAIANDPTQRQSIISSASLGYEFGDPVTGAILYGGRRSRIVGATPLGDRKLTGNEYQGPFSASDAFNRQSPSPFEFPSEDLSYEYLPSIELDGVALRHQRTLLDPFYEMENQVSTELQAINMDHNGFTWNDYGDEYVVAPFSPTGFELDPKEFLKKDYFRNGPHYSNDDFLPFYYWKDFKDPLTPDKTFDPHQLNRVNSAGFKEDAKAIGSCGDPAYTNQVDCELHGSCPSATPAGTKTQVECDEIDCEKIAGNIWNAANRACEDSAGIAQAFAKSWLQYVWNSDPASARSGYLDIYPCWGFEQKVVVANEYSNAFDDVIDIKEEKEPIKGMFWDDDPYRDFHPSDGIFSVFEFYNPGLGVCIDVGCDKKWTGGSQCLKTSDGVQQPNPPIADEDACLDTGGHCSSGLLPNLGADITHPDFDTKEKCEAPEADGVSIHTWTSVNTWIEDGDDIDESFEGEVATRLCQKNGGSIKGPVLALKNQQVTCECDPHAPFSSRNFKAFDLTMPVKDDCAKKREAAGLDTGITANTASPTSGSGAGGFIVDLSVKQSKTKWVSHCTESLSCKSSTGTEITQLHNQKLGVGNTIQKTRGGCENACFLIGSNTLVVAYYLKDVSTALSKGDPASHDLNPEHFKNLKNGANDTVAIILDGLTCTDAFGKGAYEWVPIDHEGRRAMPASGSSPSTANKFGSAGGPYSDECEAISFHSPVSGDCIYAAPLQTAGLPSPYRTLRECEAAIKNGESVEWILPPDFAPAKITDIYYGKEVDAKQNPKPGYVTPRFRFTKGECSGGTDASFRPETVRDPSYTIPQDCYASSPKNQIGYDKVTNGLENVWIPRTATIPIKIDGYGKTNTANEIGGLVNKFDEPVQLNDNSYYRATVTELRHAAISFDSWTSYLRAFAPHLPCYMFSKNAFFSNAWADLCPVTHRDVSVGVGTASVDALSWIASALSRGQSNTTFTKAQNHQVSNRERAEKLAGRGPQKGELTDYEESKLQLSMAYKAVRDVATNFYGRKFLVPLPVVPPKKLFCSGYKPKTNASGSLVKGARYDNQADCEVNGFEWKAHPDLSKMLDSSGVEDINNWEIVNSAWPGGTVDLKTDSADSYPTNLNFWNDDGNLKAFALFPSKVKNRINEQQQNVGFNNYDPEKIQTNTGVGMLDDLAGVSSLNLTQIAAAFGEKTYVEIEVDPKIYWIHERSLMERTLGQQYFMHETGETQDNPLKATREFHKYAEVGTRTNPIELNDRSLFKEHDVNELGQTGSVTEKGEAGPRRPYALISLPERVVYQENDKIGSEKLNGNGSAVPNFKTGFEVPLSETKNSEDLFKAWIFQQGSETGAALKFVAANLNRQSADSFSGVDVNRASMIAAAFKPWHAGIPQESNLYTWGPFKSGSGYGKVVADFDNSYHPAVFGGEDFLQEAAYQHVKAKKEKDADKSFEAGSVTLASGPEHKLGAQPFLEFPTNLPQHLGGGIISRYDPNVLAPYVTDIAVDVGTNGISTRYSFNSQARFGDLDSIYEQRLKKAQKDLIRNLKKQEADQRRTRRNISEFKE